MIEFVIIMFKLSLLIRVWLNQKQRNDAVIVERNWISTRKKSWLAYVVCALLLIGCGDSSQAHDDKSASKSMPLEQKSINTDSLSHECKMLSINKKNDYQLMFGKVIEGQWVGEVADYLNNKHHKEKWAFGAKLAPLTQETQNQDDFFSVSTEWEPVVEGKEEYMLKDKSYSFCAYEVKSGSQYNKGHKIYRIDVVKTIRELK